MVLTIASADTNAWANIGVPLTIAFLGATVAAFWPWIQSFQRGRRFEGIIRRELEEIGPFPNTPDPDKPWWEHAQRRFIHEELFQRHSISQNRDFLLSLDPTLVYQVSQLWIALEKRDGRQWLYYLGELAYNDRVFTRKLQSAHDKWIAIIEAQSKKRAEWLDPMGVPSEFRQEAVLARVPELFDRRFDAYSHLLPLTDYGPEKQPKDLTAAERGDLADKLTTWFYENGAGLLLSGRAFVQFQRARDTIAKEDASPIYIHRHLSKLRTELKIDLGVRQPQERDVALAWPEEERW
jgi:hypothetical protein